MSELQNKWDIAYRNADYSKVNASDVLIQNQHLLPSTGSAVDLACGLGGNAILMAQSSLSAHAWDISPVALAQLDQYAQDNHLNIKTQLRDIEQYPPAAHQFDVVVVTHFLHRPTFSALIDSLKSGGLLYYQTFIRAKVNSAGPSNPNYLLSENELLRLCAGLQILHYREEGRQGNEHRGWRNQAMIVAKKPSTRVITGE